MVSNDLDIVKLPDKNQVCAIVSHDAGGAEILASYVLQNKVCCRFVLEGPAIKVFERRFGKIKIDALGEGLGASDWCLCGTSWQSDLEWRAIQIAQNTGKRTVAFIDHWMNYKERFTRYDIQHLPDEIWVGDDDSKELARQKFPNTPIRIVENPYFIDVKIKIAELTSRIPRLAESADKIALFVCENISGHARLRYGDERHWGYTEFDAIEYFFEHIGVLGDRIKKVVIRPHPSDSPGKYDHVMREYSSVARLSDGKSLLDEIATSDLVVGCESMAMVVGLLAQKKVISCIPPGGTSCRLPQKGILHLRELVDNCHH